MIRAVDVYLRLRRTAGFKLESAEYLLRSFAHFATTRGEQFIRAQTAIDWAALGPSLAQRDARLKAIKPTGGPSNGGLDNNEWTAVVARDGTVCAVTFSGSKPQDQWPASRGIAAEKTNTANGVSLKQFAFSTANLYAGAQPAAPLFGMATSDPRRAGCAAFGRPEPIRKRGRSDDRQAPRRGNRLRRRARALSLRPQPASSARGGLFYVFVQSNSRRRRIDWGNFFAPATKPPTASPVRGDFERCNLSTNGGGGANDRNNL
jgi:hypothetical protein